MGKIPDKKFPVKIAGFPLPLYLGILALVIVCMYTGCLPGGIVGGMIFLMVLGEGLNAIGNSVPVVKTYLGHLYSGRGGYSGGRSDTGTDTCNHR